MPTTLEAARVLIVQQLATLSGLTVVLEAVDPVRVATPYIVVGQAVSNEPIGFPRVAGTAYVQGYEARIPIAAHGTSAAAPVAAYLSRLLVTSDTLARAIRAAGVWPFRFVGQRQVSAVYRTGHEPRAVAEVFVRYDLAITGATDVDAVDAIVVGMTQTGGGTTIDLDPAFTVPEE